MSGTATDASLAAQPRLWLHQTVLPAAVMLFVMPTTGLVWYTHTHLDGSLLRLLQLANADGVGAVFAAAWGPIFFGSRVAWIMIGVFATLALLLMRVLPGRMVPGATTPAGDTPLYKANGRAAFVVTLALFLVCSFGLKLFPPTIVYDHFGELIGALNLTGLALCVGLYLKGRFAPSSADHGTSRNPLFDYYWGTELHPRIAGWDVKMFTNCRFGMMGWAVILLSFAAKQYALYGFLSDAMMVAVALQLAYIAKFFWWETGYLRSLDMAHDRAGFYICWACLTWLPAIYSASTLFLVRHPNHLGAPLSGALLVVGGGAILVNYLADAQRQKVRAPGGLAKIWGKPPVVIEARYRTAQGETRTNPLLASGWWGLARHFHYGPELLAAIAWTTPVLFGRFLPWLYVVYLTVLLLHRAWRDDERCAAKYGADWDAYRARVPYWIVPGLL